MAKPTKESILQNLIIKTGDVELIQAYTAFKRELRDTLKDINANFNKLIKEV